MKKTIILSCCLLLITTTYLNAQIQDIKKEANKNKNISGNNQKDNSIGDDIAEGCFSSLIESFFGCLFSPGANTDSNIAHNDVNDANQDTSLYPVQNNLITEDSTALSKIGEEDINTGLNDNSTVINQQPKEFSLDLRVNSAYGLEFSSDKTYQYMNFIPGLRANIAFFLVDFRYNMLSEMDNGFSDFYKTWDLTFLFQLPLSQKSDFFFGAGMHYDQYVEKNFFALHTGAKIGFSRNSNFITLDGRLATDFNDPDNPDDTSYPFSEVSAAFNTAIIKSDKINGFLVLGAFYHNYYETADIWAFQLGFTLNLKK